MSEDRNERYEAGDSFDFTQDLNEMDREDSSSSEDSERSSEDSEGSEGDSEEESEDSEEDEYNGWGDYNSSDEEDEPEAQEGSWGNPNPDDILPVREWRPPMKNLGSDLALNFENTIELYKYSDYRVRCEIANSAIVRQIEWYTDYFSPILKAIPVKQGESNEIGTESDRSGIFVAPTEISWIAITRRTMHADTVAARVVKVDEPVITAKTLLRMHLYVLEGIGKLVYHTTPIVHNNIFADTVKYDAENGAPILTDFSFAWVIGDPRPPNVRSWKAHCVEARIYGYIATQPHDGVILRQDVEIIREIAVEHILAELKEVFKDLSEESNTESVPKARAIVAATTRFVDAMEGRSWKEMRVRLLHTANGWDVYSVSRLYLKILETTLDSSPASAWTARYRATLEANIFAPPEIRESSSAMYERVMDSVGTATLVERTALALFS